jgi:hypothetical protein
VTRLLLLACSARKRQDAAPLPALDRYDGPVFRVVRRYLRDRPAAELRVVILSARFGLLDAGDQLPNYDCQMTSERSRKLARQVDERLAALDAMNGSPDRAEDCFALLGKRYLDVLERCSSPLARLLVARNAPGGQGIKLTHLHRWLRKDTTGSIIVNKPLTVPPDQGIARAVRFKGQDFTLSASDLARLIECHAAPLPTTATNAVWKAVVGGRLVAPKWLVAAATDIPVAAFTTGEARRFLARLGVETIAS